MYVCIRTKYLHTIHSLLFALYLPILSDVLHTCVDSSSHGYLPIFGRVPQLSMSGTWYLKRYVVPRGKARQGGLDWTTSVPARADGRV